jgi:hypothetical protein
MAMQFAIAAPALKVASSSASRRCKYPDCLAIPAVLSLAVTAKAFIWHGTIKQSAAANLSDFITHVFVYPMLAVLAPCHDHGIHGGGFFDQAK